MAVNLGELGCEAVEGLSIRCFLLSPFMSSIFAEARGDRKLTEDVRDGHAQPGFHHRASCLIIEDIGEFDLEQWIVPVVRSRRKVVDRGIVQVSLNHVFVRRPRRCQGGGREAFQGERDRMIEEVDLE